MRNLSDLSFVDLYIGPDFCDVTGLGGAEGRCTVPEELQQTVALLREECESRYKQFNEEEFSLKIGNTIYRVTALTDITGAVVFVLRRSSAAIRPMNSLGLHPQILNKILAKDMRGLVLIAGEMKAGKTSTAASMVSEWLRLNGGVGIALEDPIETPLNGVWGKGRCLQIQVSRKDNGYREAMPRALRSGASIILIGEIRNAETAVEVVQASINGHLIVSTLHAGSVAQAVERLQTFAGSLSNANAVIANGLAYVIYQSLERVPMHRADVGSTAHQQYVVRLRAQCLEVNNMHAVKAKIRDGKANVLADELSAQASRLTWANGQKQ